ncbi:hypothetical protein ABT124_28280 [Streptomyces sp. NPDC001982]|uniref:hypothetical protein n=1 Tax=Streptomyces sp. NPDC001982 TaxID=3154405 RepID=UPI00333097AD
MPVDVSDAARAEHASWGEAVFGATWLGWNGCPALEKSSGVIANALDKLVKQNIAQQVSDRPRAYRLATPQADAQPTGHAEPGWFPVGDA